MSIANKEQLRFPSTAGFTVRADFDGGAMSSDFGNLLLSGVDRQVGLSDRIASSLTDYRHPAYIDHTMRDLIAQRLYQIASGHSDGNDSNCLRLDPILKLSVGRKPLDNNENLASGPTFSRLENGASKKDLYRFAKALVESFIDSYSAPPASIVIDIDHSEDPTHGQQEFSFFNGHYRSYCYLPLFIFEGLSGKIITAVLRPGKTPTGSENAMILKRLLKLLRQHWPETHIIVRGDGHFSNPESMKLIENEPLTDFVFGLSSNKVLARLAAPVLKEAKALHKYRCESAGTSNSPLPDKTRIFEEIEYQAASWANPWRVILKAEILPRGENPRFVVTSLDNPTPEIIYEQLYCARGNDENFIKAVKNDLKSDRTSCSTFLANYMRLLFACAAYSLHHALRTQTLANTELANAQPTTVINKLFKIAVRVVQYKDRVRLHLPTSCPVKHLLRRTTEILYLVPPASVFSS